MRKRSRVFLFTFWQPGCLNVVLLGTHARTSVRFVSERLGRHPPSATEPVSCTLVRSCNPCMPRQDTLYALFRPGARIRSRSVPERFTSPTTRLTFPEHQLRVGSEWRFHGIF